MNKKLTARVQKLNPVLNDQEASFSFCIVIEPESKKLEITKGTVYGIFDLSCDKNFDISIVEKLIKDVLSDSYYSNESYSPTQALEKSLLKVKETITKLQQSDTLTDIKLVFNATLTALWGNILYLVCYNDGLAYLMKNTDIEPINTKGEGNLHFAFVKVDEDQVVMLCTKNFGVKYPPNILLSKAISAKELDLSDSCLLIKFIKDDNISESELKDLSTLTSQKKFGINNVKDLLKQKFQTFSFVKVESNSLINAKPKITSSKNKKFKFFFAINFFKTKKNYIFILFLILITLVIFGILYFLYPGNFLFFKKINTDKNAIVQKDQVIEPQNLKLTNDPIIEDTSNDKSLGIIRVDVSNTFYDMTLSDPQIKASHIKILDDSILVIDSTTGNSYTSLLNLVGFKLLSHSFKDLKFLDVNEQNELVYFDLLGIKVFNLKNNSITNTFTILANNSLALFSNFIYTFEGEKLLRYYQSGSSLTPTLWAQSSEFINAKDMQIAYSIYVATFENKIVKYTTGKKVNFEIKLNDGSNLEINTFVVKPEFKNIYISDSLNKRIVVLNLQGEFVKQYRFVDNQGFFDIKDIDVSTDESNLYVLSSNKIYEIKL